MPPDAACHRRRGSVLVLVMTLLVILFVTGIALLATMSFEADMIAVDRLRDRGRVGVSGALEDFGSILRDGLMAAPGIPFGGKVIGESPGGFAELPGVQNVFAPIEPYRLGNRFVFGSFTDIHPDESGRHDGSWLRNLLEYNAYRVECEFDAVPIEGIDVSWQSGETLGTCPIVPGVDPFYPDQVVLHPVDADGDGISDTFAFTLSELGFSAAQVAALSPQLNSPTNPGGEVYLGLRVIAHGGLVNLNESHPTLIANVLDLWTQDPSGQPRLWVEALEEVDGPDAELGFFRHRPTRAQVAYSPSLQEVMLRRRILLPPRIITPSLLQGNPLLDSESNTPSDRYGNADLATRLFPPDPGDKYGGVAYGVGFETVYESRHRYKPFTLARDATGAWVEPYDPADLDSYPLWAVRMEPFTWAKQAGAVPEDYDRRHLVTTVSYDDLLSRGGRWQDNSVDPPREWDLLERMREANRAADVSPQCLLLPFEYADYPQDIPNRTVPNSLDGGLQVECTCPTQDQEVCRVDPRKGRLLLSLAWLDDAADVGLGTLKRRIHDVLALRNRLIHDMFMMLVRNARGPYWDFPCVTDFDCVSGQERCDTARPEPVCVDWPSGKRTRRERRLSRTAASLTANLLDYMDDNSTCLGGPSNGQTCLVDEDCHVEDCNTEECHRGTCQPVRECRLRDDGTWTGRRCVVDEDCESGEICHQIRECVGGARDGRRCITDNNCPDGTCLDTDSGIPTRIALRSFDFSDKTCVVTLNDVSTGWKCAADTDCGANETCLPTAGWEFGSEERLPTDPPQYVYGLERQPYITEVATVADDLNVTARAVELFNPYAEIEWDADGDAVSDYFLVEVDENGLIANRIPLRKPLGAMELTVFKTDPDGDFALGGLQQGPAGRIYTADRDLTFKNAWVIYLVRTVRNYPGVEIVVDQFEVDEPQIARHDPLGTGDPGPYRFSMERMVGQSSYWTVTVPDTSERTDHSLADWNNHTNPDLRPVEVNFANTGRLSRDADTGSGAAFPTTGSLLLLMRHANRSLDEYSPTNTDLAFTTWLNKETTWREEDPPGSGAVVTWIVKEETQIDNGRMPVFDLGDPFVRTDPNSPWGYAHHVDPARTGTNNPGGLQNLPWGQLVFDYFTVLPLSSGGPYVDPDWDPEGPEDPELALPDSIPRVDLNGLRVHGRININAAPWKVLAGLPLVPMERIPTPFRAKIRSGAGLDGIPVDRAEPIGDSLALAIVAYREVREVTDGPASPTFTTGDYGDNPQGRGWRINVPAARRGTGFLSVGELSNVRNLGVTRNVDGFSAYRIDGGELDRNNPEYGVGYDPDYPPDYVRAVALLASLGDWVTVRSQVFTVYGTLRGEMDEDILGPNPTDQDRLRAADVDSRAIRFQETVDRLPTFLGEPAPVRIGERIMKKYIDVRND